MPRILALAAANSSSVRAPEACSSARRWISSASVVRALVGAGGGGAGGGCSSYPRRSSCWLPPLARAGRVGRPAGDQHRPAARSSTYHSHRVLHSRERRDPVTSRAPPSRRSYILDAACDVSSTTSQVSPSGAPSAPAAVVHAQRSSRPDVAAGREAPTPTSPSSRSATSRDRACARSPRRGRRGT